MIKSSILITAEKKEKTIIKTIKSCLKQNEKNFEIIVVYTKLINEKIVKEKIKSKKVLFLKIRKKIKNKIHDQLFKINFALKKSKGENIFLLDGDDIFLKRKLNFVNKIIKKREIMILDNHYISNNLATYKNITSSYRQNFLYKKLFNDWPKGICTSSISIKKSLIVRFFREVDFKKYKYLAIDALLSIYCSEKKQFLSINEYLTTKKDTYNSIDKNFLGIKNKMYWLRRIEQHRFNFFVKRKKYFNIDYLITYLFCLFIKN